jgi:hypothetical protein
MTGLHPRAMQPRDETAHGLVNHALDRGYLDTHEPFAVDSLESHEVANDWRLRVGRAADHLGVSDATWVVDQAGNPCPRDCQPPGTPHGIRFKLYSKDAAREHVTREADGNPANLKYNPFQRAEPRRIADDGRALR